MDTPNTKSTAQASEEYAPARMRKRGSIKETIYRWLTNTTLFLSRNIMDMYLWYPKQKFYRLFGGHHYFKALSSAIEFDLFTYLDNTKKSTSKEIAAHLEIEYQPCRILLLALVSSGALKKKGNYYSNTLMSKIAFSANSDRNVIAYVRLQDQVMYPALAHFHDSVKSYTNVGLSAIPGQGDALYEKISNNEKIEPIFQDAMKELSNQTNKFLGKYFDFSKIKSIVDVGGGDGSNLIQIARFNPDVKGVVFDYDSVGEIARKNIEKNNLSNRLGAVEGNIFEDNLPNNVDCVMFCHFFTIWSKDENLQLLKKAYDALPEGGTCLIFNMMQNNDESGPHAAAIGSTYFLSCATGKGMLYTWNEYEDLFKQAGFKGVSKKMLPMDHGVIWGVKK